jgi:hypothetical protein
MRHLLTSRLIAAVLVIALIDGPLVAAQSAETAQDTVEPTTTTTPAVDENPSQPELTPAIQPGIPRRLLDDQATIWSSPQRLRKKDAKWLLPIAGAAAFAFTTDNRTSHYFDNNAGLQAASHKVGRLGAPYALLGASGAMYGLGKLTHNKRLATTGIMAIEAGIAATGATQGMKVLTSRTRPYRGGNGDFWNGGNSFPSGHAMMTWSTATVIADQYRDKPFLKIGLYGLATAVSVSRVTERKHYVSDVVIGSTIGYLIGKYITRRHRDSNRR